MMILMAYPSVGQHASPPARIELSLANNQNLNTALQMSEYTKTKCFHDF